MIKIHDQLWVVIGHKREVEDSEHLLSYMTHTEYTKDGDPTPSFNSRMSTGRKWARDYRENKEGGEVVFDNTPQKGFRIIGSVSRWSTSNKVIRVEDPRGFVVEVPTGNLTTLLKHTVVDHSEVMEECVWGREANNHVLLPTNSDVYQKAVKQTEQYQSRVSFNKLSVGDIVKFSVDDNLQYIYVGRAKAVWEISTKQASKTGNRLFYQRPFIRKLDDPVIGEPVLVEDKKWCFVFKAVGGKPNWVRSWEYKLSGKCVVAGKTKELPELEVFPIYLPDRLKDDDYYSSIDFNGTYKTSEVVDIKWKNV